MISLVCLHPKSIGSQGVTCSPLSEVPLVSETPAFVGLRCLISKLTGDSMPLLVSFRFGLYYSSIYPKTSRLTSKH